MSERMSNEKFGRLDMEVDADIVHREARRARAEEVRLWEELEKASGSEARYVAELTRLRETLAAEAEELRKEREVALARAVMAEQTRDGLGEENRQLLLDYLRKAKETIAIDHANSPVTIRARMADSELC